MKARSQTNSRPTKRRRFRFGTRTLLIVTSLFAALLGSWIAPSLRQRRAVALYRELGFAVEYAEADYRIPEDWIVTHPDFFCELKKVGPNFIDGIAATEITHLNLPEGFDNAALGNFLPNVKKVFCQHDFDVNTLQSLSKLKTLHVTNISNKELPDLPQVETLMIVPGEYVVDCRMLRHFPNLKSLAIGSPIENLEEVENVPLKSLLLGTSTAGPAELDLSPLGRLDKLTMLMLHLRAPLDLAPLADCDRLESLNLGTYKPIPVNLRPLLNAPSLKVVKLSFAINEESGPYFGLSEEAFPSKPFEIEAGLSAVELPILEAHRAR